MQIIGGTTKKQEWRNYRNQGGSVNADKTTSIRMDFEDNDTLALLSGEHNHYLAHIEKSLDVSLDSFGNSIKNKDPATLMATVVSDTFNTMPGCPTA